MTGNRKSLECRGRISVSKGFEAMRAETMRFEAMIRSTGDELRLYPNQTLVRALYIGVKIGSDHAGGRRMG